MSGAGYRPFSDLAEPILNDPERAARVAQIKEQVMAADLGTNSVPDRIAIDAHGYGWRVWNDQDLWSMVPQNPDNEPIPAPLTWFVKAEDTDRTMRTEHQLADDEIEAIAACVEAIGCVGTDAQDRILDYLCARYGRRIAMADV